MGKVDDAVASMIANLKNKTGKSLEQWVKLVQAEKLEKHGERVAFLKSKHGLSHGYANLVAHFVAGGGSLSRGEDPVAAQYEGAKASLRPAYDSIAAAVRKFGAMSKSRPRRPMSAFAATSSSRSFNRPPRPDSMSA